jgi:hypothetical protein
VYTSPSAQACVSADSCPDTVKNAGRLYKLCLKHKSSSNSNIDATVSNTLLVSSGSIECVSVSSSFVAVCGHVLC